MSLYDSLGVAKDATNDEIKKSYRKLAMRCHPDKDKSPEATSEFQKLNQAYEVLSDPERREYYDLTGKTSNEGIVVVKNEPSDTTLNVPFIDLIVGATREVDISEEVYTAPDGKEIKPILCPSCGNGLNIIHKMLGIMCNVCRGTGFIAPLNSFKVRKEHRVKITIEPKSWNGRVIHLTDINKKVKLIAVADEPNVKIKDNNILRLCQLNIYQALCGFEETIKIGEETHKISISHPIKPTEPFIIDGAGLYTRHGNRGKFGIIFEVKYPEKISETQREYLKKCEELESNFKED